MKTIRELAEEIGVTKQAIFYHMNKPPLSNELQGLASKEARIVNNRAEKIAERAEYIRGLGDKIDGLKGKRQLMGVFTSKKDINGQIAQLENSREIAENAFVREYKLPSAQAEAEKKRLENWAQNLERKQAELRAKIAPLLEAREASALEYHKQQLSAEMRSDWEKTENALMELEEKAHAQPPAGQNENARIESERRLEMPNERDFYAILEALPDDHAQILYERREVERERVRVRERGR